ncbi:MAG: hypothetical protein AAF399_25565 [Bacteroidota bacterium]
MKKTIRTWIFASVVVVASGFFIRATLVTNFKRSVALTPNVLPTQSPTHHRVAPPDNTLDTAQQMKIPTPASRD